MSKTKSKQSAEIEQSFHIYGAAQFEVNENSGKAKWTLYTITDRQLRYRFHLHCHPYASELASRIDRGSLAALLAANTDRMLTDEKYFSEIYRPSGLVDNRYPKKTIDFDIEGAYSLYNWELFFHAPLTFAIHLSRNQQFEEAQRWLHTIFDPTVDGVEEMPAPARFWKVKPFVDGEVRLIESLLLNLASGEDKDLQRDTARCMAAWRKSPFSPHAVARYRPTAYMFKTVTAYLDNLIEWGDSLFRQDTREAINEAAQHYVTAANLLGTRPQAIPKAVVPRRRTYASLKNEQDVFANAVREIEVDVPHDLLPHPGAVEEEARLCTTRSIGRDLYFCLPPNEKLIGYWDVVADRLFKIRNSLNLQGVFRQLPLFEPPIDPALLAKASAAGVNVAAVVSGDQQSRPLVRFQVLIQKALEICQEVKSLGGQLLAAMEKEDNEALSILRAKHESAVLELAESVRYQQVQEAVKGREGIEVALANAVDRWKHYERLLGRNDSELTLPEFAALDEDGLRAKTFRDQEPSMAKRSIKVRNVQGVEGPDGALAVSASESQELSNLDDAHEWNTAAALTEIVSAGLAAIPYVKEVAAWGGLGFLVEYGGKNLSSAASATASSARARAGYWGNKAAMAAKVGAYQRREQEWALQSNAASGEINQTFKQLRAAQIRESIANQEWKNHQQQIRFAKEIEEYLTDERKKRTNREFYSWMRREVRGLYTRCYEFAHETARKAERALQYELGATSLRFIEPTYAGGLEGLVAGEKLYLSLKRMEMAYQELNRREYELTKNVSLLQLNPGELMRLRLTGKCSVSLPEELFDIDGAGQYFRRIKTVSLSIPCVAGPYVGISCKLTHVKSVIRTSPLLKSGKYPRQANADERFVDIYGNVQSIVTSGASNDSGMFETNLRDERYLPFEGTGAVSTWELELPRIRQFDYSTISDVVMHVRYTAREGGAQLRNHANDRFVLSHAGAGFVRLFSLRHEFATEWARFKAEGAATQGRLAVAVKSLHFPFWLKDRLEGYGKKVELFAGVSQGDRQKMPSEVGVECGGVSVKLERDSSFNDPNNEKWGLFRGELPVGDKCPIEKGCELEIKFASDDNLALLDDVWLAITLLKPDPK